MAKKKKSKVNGSHTADIQLLLNLPLETQPQGEDDRLKELLGPQSYALYQGCTNPSKLAAFDSEKDLDLLISNLQEYSDSLPEEAPVVPVFSQPEATSWTTDLLTQELGYIATIFKPQELRTLCADIYYHLQTGTPMSHLDISDMITDCLLPSPVRTALVTADAGHKYSTTQYLQGYLCLRIAYGQYALILARAILDGLKAGTDSIYWSGRRPVT